VFYFGVRQQLLSSVNQTDRRLTVSIRYLYNYNEPLYNAEQRLRV